MKIKLLFFITLLPLFALRAQTTPTYVIGKTVNYDAAKLDKAMQKCTLDKYRREDQRVVMNFEDGSKVEILSVKELRNGVNAIAANGNNAFQLNNTFILTPEGYILERVKNEPTLEEQKRSIVNKQKNH